MRVTVCQLPNRPADLETAWGQLCEHVADQESDLVLLPEMPFSPWLAADRQVVAARWDEAVAEHERWLERLGELGARAVVSTRPVTEARRRLNRAFVQTPDDETIEVHDKAYLPDEEGFWEATWYQCGDRAFEPFAVGPAAVGIQICTEMWFFEHARAYGAAGVELLVVPRATPHSTLDKWIAGGQAVAVVSGCYCLSSNLWMPPDSSADLAGGAWIIDPDGEVLAVTSAGSPFATRDIDLDAARAAKRTYPRYVDR